MGRDPRDLTPESSGISRPAILQWTIPNSRSWQEWQTVPPSIHSGGLATLQYRHVLKVSLRISLAAWIKPISAIMSRDDGRWSHLRLARRRAGPEACGGRPSRPRGARS